MTANGAQRLGKAARIAAEVLTREKCFHWPVATSGLKSLHRSRSTAGCLESALPPFPRASGGADITVLVIVLCVHI